MTDWTTLLLWCGGPVSVISSSWDLIKQPALSSPDVSALVLYLKYPASQETVQQAFAPLLGEPTTRTVGRFRYWKSKGDGDVTCVWRSDDGRTVIVGLDEPGFLRVPAAGERGVNDTKWFGGSAPPLVGYLAPKMIPWYKFTSAPSTGYPDIHDRFGLNQYGATLPGSVPLDTRLVADVLVYVPFFRLKANSEYNNLLDQSRFLTPELHASVLQLAHHCTEFIIAAKLDDNEVRSALYYSAKSSQLVDDQVPRHGLGGQIVDAQTDRRLGPTVDSLLLSTRVALSRSRDSVSRTNSADVLDQLESLNAAEEILDAARVYATHDAVTINAVVPTQTLERLLQSFRLSTIYSSEQPK